MLECHISLVKCLVSAVAMRPSLIWASTPRSRRASACAETCWVRDIVYTTCGDFLQQSLEPVAIEASLLVEMAQQVLSAC